MTMDHSHRQAPELRVPFWIDAAGAPLATPLTLADLGSGWKILYAFQHWCPGCHARGFPALRALYDALADKGVGFAAIQTVFEGEAVNIANKLAENQARYDLPIPFGHDPRPEGGRYPGFMEDYRTGGTPWFTIIDPEGRIAHADFAIDAARLIGGWESLTAISRA